MARSTTETLWEGKRAPRFCLPNHNGAKRCFTDLLANLRDDGFVLVYFYPRDNTPGCTREAINLSENKRKLSARGITVVGISKLTPASKEKFRQKHDLTIELLADEDCAVATAYGVYRQKNMYGKKVWGIARESFLIAKSGKIVKHFTKVTPDTHAAEIIDAVAALRKK